MARGEQDVVANGEEGVRIYSCLGGAAGYRAIFLDVVVNVQECTTFF